MESEVAAGFLTRFGIPASDAVISAAVKQCVSFDVPARTLLVELETYIVNKQLDAPAISAKDVEALRPKLEKWRQAPKAVAPTTTRPTKASRGSDALSPGGGSERSAKRVAQTAMSPEHSARPVGDDAPREVLVDTFKDRKNKGERVVVFNDSLAADPGQDDDTGFELRILGSNSDACPKFMFEPPVDRISKSQQRLLSVSQMLIESASFSESSEQKSVEPLDAPMQEPVLVRGRIGCDGEGRPTLQSLLLQDKVASVPVDVSAIPALALFPGQIVIAEGTNPTGRKFYASRIHSDCGGEATLDTERGMRIVAAAGPFTTTANHDYDPLSELLDAARSFRPHILLLMGPFVDTQHPSIRDHKLDKQFSKLFQEEVASRLVDFLSEAPEFTHVLLMPSTRDAVHPFPLPQPPLNKEDPTLSIPSRIQCVPNPCTLEAAESKICIGACSQDVLFALNREELAVIGDGVPSDKMGRLAQHLVSQRSYYPLHPGPPGSAINLASSENLSMPQVPHVLFLPSDLTQFAKRAGSGTVCVNPGRLAKGTGGGTYARVIIHPPTAARSEKGTAQAADVTMVEIFRV